MRGCFVILLALVLVSGGAPAAANTDTVMIADTVKISDATARGQLIRAALAIWSSGNCTDRNNPNCTSFEQINQSTITGVITLKQASGCAIVVTGGTETGHGATTGYSHWNGWKVDIGKSTCIAGYITAYFTYLGYVAGWGYQYEAPSGNLYTDEGTHWDIVYYTCGCS